MENFEVTYGYKAVISVSVKANSIEEAQEKAKKQIDKMRGRINSSTTQIQDDCFRPNGDGIVNLSKTFDELYY